MKAKRPPTTIWFECRECGSHVTAAAYRAACPACGGSLAAAARSS